MAPRPSKQARLAHGRLPIVLAGLAVAFAATFAHVQQPTLLRHLEARAYDHFVRSRHDQTLSAVPIIVDIDEASLNRYGQWPWPRYLVALLLARIQEHEPAAVALDIVFADPDRTSPAVIRRDLAAILGVQAAFTGIPEGLMDHDAVLADVLATGPFVLGYPFHYGRAGRPPGDCTLTPLRLGVMAEAGAGPADVTRALRSAPRAACNLPALAESAAATGFFTTGPDPDGTLRRTPLLMHFGTRVQPSLALAAVMQARDAEQAVLTGDSNGASALKVAGRTIPLDEAGNLLVNWRGPGGTFAYVSASDILDGLIAPGSLGGRIVFVGTTAPGLKDLRATPLDGQHPGVEVHATVADNILRGDFLTRPSWARGLEVGTTLAAGIGFSLLIAFASPVVSLLMATASLTGLWLGAAHLHATQGLAVGHVPPMVTVAAIFTLLTLLKFLREERQKRFFRDAFSRYASRAVVEEIVRSPEKLSLEGEEREISILFADIRAFTALSESLAPPQVSALLQRYFTPMTRCITERQGTLDKFIGDAVAAFWNAPLAVAEHPVRAVDASLAMLAELEELNKGFERDFGRRIRIGIGLHTGRARVGNMGSQELFDYTAIGDAVNVAARLESLTKVYGTELLVSDAVRRVCAGRFAFLEADVVRLAGRSEPIRIHVAMRPEQAKARAEELALFERGRASYLAGDFADAQAFFVSAQELNPAEGLHGVFATRCAAFAVAPPEADWDGAYEQSVK